jgi:4-hydroxy-3-polyprenylbenzoate decarboxylase
MKVYTVVITGASGSVYGLRLVEQLLLAGGAVTVIATQAGSEVMAFETGFSMPGPDEEERLLRFLEIDRDDAHLRIARDCDLFDAIASGSRRVDGMVVAPASMGYCGSLASGLGATLSQRAADVQLKERRPLIVVPRETPLSLIHLRNLTTLAEAGAQVLPASPGFYGRPETLDDAVNFVVGKVLDQLGVENALFRRWRE